MQCSCNEETNLVISGQMTRFIECNDGAFSERISLNVFRWTGREVIKFGPNNGIYLGDKMEGRVGWKIIGSSLGPMYTRRMKRRSKFKVTYMYKRITGIGSKREETGARWNGWGELGKNFRDAWRETCVTDGEIFGSRRWDYSDRDIKLSNMLKKIIRIEIIGMGRKHVTYLGIQRVTLSNQESK